MYADKTIRCRDCGMDFVFSGGEQEFYASKGLVNEQQLQDLLHSGDSDHLGAFQIAPVYLSTSSYRKTSVGFPYARRCYPLFAYSAVVGS